MSEQLSAPLTRRFGRFFPFSRSFKISPVGKFLLPFLSFLFSLVSLLRAFGWRRPFEPTGFSLRNRSSRYVNGMFLVRKVESWTWQGAMVPNCQGNLLSSDPIDRTSDRLIGRKNSPLKKSLDYPRPQGPGMLSEGLHDH